MPRSPSASLVGPAHHVMQPRLFRRYPVGNREHRHFLSFERDLLGKHNVTSRQGTFWNETPPDLRLPFFIELQNIAHSALVNSIPSASVRTSDFEMTFGIKLSALIWRQPFSQKMTRTRFRAILLVEAPIKRAEGTQTRTTGDAAASE